MKSTRIIMGMPITVEAVTGDEAAAKSEIARVFEYFQSVDETFSTYKTDSEISRINTGELRTADASDAVREVLRACADMKTQTDGYFDIRRADGQIDPSGLVKGWSIGKVAKLLERGGVRNYLVEAGGDIQAKGRNAQGEAWQVGIRNPFKPHEIVKVLRLEDGAVATSGTYERGEHIYDPHTGRATAGLASLTVVGPDILEADVYATAAFAMGESGAEWAARQGLECYQIGLDGAAVFTPGLERYVN